MPDVPRQSLPRMISGLVAPRPALHLRSSLGARLGLEALLRKPVVGHQRSRGAASRTFMIAIKAGDMDATFSGALPKSEIKATKFLKVCTAAVLWQLRPSVLELKDGLGTTRLHCWLPPRRRTPSMMDAGLLWPFLTPASTQALPGCR